MCLRRWKHKRKLPLLKLCVESTDNKGPESKAEEKSKVETPEKCSEFNTIKDAKEEVKSLEGEREAE